MEYMESLLRQRRPETVSSEDVKAAREHALEVYPQEAVGLVTDRGYVRCTNVSPTPEEEFILRGEEVAGNYPYHALIHSHPDRPPAPSRADMEAQLAMDVPWGILSVGKGDVAKEPLWFGDSCPVPPLVGRPFLHGVTDCYALIRDWYRKERGITLLEFPRDDNWWDAEKDNPNLYLANFEKAGFKRYEGPSSGLQPGDVFFCRFRSKVVNHAGVYLGGGLILHHLAGHTSHRSPLNIWNRTVEFWARYGGGDA